VRIKRLLKWRDDMPVLYSNLGYAYFSQGKYDNSDRRLPHRLAIDPQFFERGSSRTGSNSAGIRSVPDRGRFYFLLDQVLCGSRQYRARPSSTCSKAKEEATAVQ